MERVNLILARKNVRITAMRQLVLEYFLQENAVLGLSELEKIFPKSDRITIYRTLKTFEENGIIHSINNGTNEVKYGLCREICTPDHHLDRHPHFHCIKCDQITCLEGSVLPSIPLPDGYIPTENKMIIKGICPNCSSHGIPCLPGRGCF